MKKNKSKLTILLVLFIFGCSSPNTSEKKLTPAFSSISKNFFEEKCALYTCHSSAYYEKSGHLNLSNKEAYNNLVNVKSTLYPARLRVKPGVPEESVLMHRLEGTLVCGPTLERAMVTEDEIKIIRQWIKEGAFNN